MATCLPTPLSEPTWTRLGIQRRRQGRVPVVVLVRPVAPSTRIKCVLAEEVPAEGLELMGGHSRAPLLGELHRERARPQAHRGRLDGDPAPRGLYLGEVRPLRWAAAGHDQGHPVRAHAALLRRLLALVRQRGGDERRGHGLAEGGAVGEGPPLRCPRQGPRVGPDPRVGDDHTAGAGLPAALRDGEDFWGPGPLDGRPEVGLDGNDDHAVGTFHGDHRG
mmetsp:Transcript_67969/g.153808  ORF Transcript_67969/g.153808 Transcript_67969/m.153808 type:complete len:220 (-) Transcript_67969:258-917(-)